MVARADGGGLLTQPQSMAPRINILDTIFIFVSSCIRERTARSRFSTQAGHSRYGLITSVSRAYHACVCHPPSYTANCAELGGTLKRSRARREALSQQRKSGNMRDTQIAAISFSLAARPNSPSLLVSLVISFLDNYRNALNIHIKHGCQKDMIRHAYHEVTFLSRKKNRPGGGSRIAV